jgi:hypothetical protein
MSGKRVRCGCGEIFSVSPSSPTQSNAVGLSDDRFEIPDTWSFPTGPAAPIDESSILFQCSYGLVRRSAWWLLGASAIVGSILIPAGFFWNEGWTFSRTPIPPWAATLLFEAAGFGMLLLVAYMLAGYFLNGRRPQRVAVTATGVIVPKYKLATDELFLPWDQVRVRLWSGPISHLDFKRGQFRTIRLVSVQFPTDEDFQTLLAHLRKLEKL